MSFLYCFIQLFFFLLFISHPKPNNNGYRTRCSFSKERKNKIQVKMWEKLLGMCLSLCSLLHTAVSMDKILHTIHSECVHPHYFHPSRHRKCMLKSQTNSQTNTHIHCRQGAWIAPVAWLWIVPIESEPWNIGDKFIYTLHMVVHCRSHVEDSQRLSMPCDRRTAAESEIQHHRSSVESTCVNHTSKFNTVSCLQQCMR